MTNINRRSFLKTTGALSLMGASGVLAGLAGRQTFAIDTSGYKALVCLFLKGGMDHADTVLPFDEASYAELAEVRQGLFNTYNAEDPTSSRHPDQLLRLNPENEDSFGGRQFALPRELSGIHALFEAGNAAIVGNVGPLIEPVTRAQMQDNSVALPPRLFSHNDQQSTWMALGVEGSRYGWGGQFADAVSGASTSSAGQFTSITASGLDVFLAGQNARPFSVGSNGVSDFLLRTQPWRLGSGRNSDRAQELLGEHFASLGVTSPSAFVRDIAATNARTVASNDAFSSARDQFLGLSTGFPDSSIGRQLQAIAETISIQGSLGVNRQIFYADTGGYDTHNAQANNLPGLHSQLDQAISAFYAAMGELGMQNEVVLFTASDFGRTLIDNGDGTDHGWGGHHFVVGGPVNGKKIYGNLPGNDPDSDEYTVSRGRLIPKTSVEQYAATLGDWFGLDSYELERVLPNLQNFDERNLGFI
ncbi:MAG: DUF1501 domain-containing protein [Pseudomonadota bacterium]